MRANTLAEITAGQIQLESSNVLAAARSMSGIITNEEEKVVNIAFVEPSHLEKMVKSTSSFALEYTMA